MDHPKTLIEFVDLYPTEEDCWQAIFEHRWPQGFVCARCGHTHAWYLRGRGLFECAHCHYQGSLTRRHDPLPHAHRPAQVVVGDLALGLHQEGSFGGRAFPRSSA